MKKIAHDPGSHRLQTFSDAVFAFACTLLVVSLEVPTSFPALRADLHGFFAFGLAFAALIYLWSIHHRIFSRFNLTDDWSTLLNACLLFVVLFFVYPLKFLAVQLVNNLPGMGAPVSGERLNFADLQSLFVIYGSAFAAVFLLYATLCWHASNVVTNHDDRRELLRTAHGLSRHYLVIACVASFSVLIAWWGIGLRFGLPGWIYFLIGPATWLNGFIADRNKRTAAHH
jgi:uncharacterized membrane protein